MLRELIPLVTALTAAGVVYVVREQRRRRMRIDPPRPHLTMREISDTPALLEIEKQCLATDDPRVAFRRAAIENAVAGLYLEAIAECGVADTGELLRAHTQTWQALREYLHLKYDDAVVDDWFDHFTLVARPYIREKVRLTREFALHLDEGAERFARIYDALLQELLKEALAAPQKKSFVPPDFSHS
ncbi:MAG: hypothetical protein ABSH32_27975 [Bryobacteraceae bacterium]